MEGICQLLKTEHIEKDYPHEFCHQNPQQILPQNKDSNFSTLIKYNKYLDRQAQPNNLNEQLLESMVDTYESKSFGQGFVQTLTLSRITELTLICAGHYANNGCMKEVGDLLFNPRLILVHIKGRSAPVKKWRHTPLTVQFKETATNGIDIIKWIQNNTILENVKKPLLPHLMDLLEQNNCADKYLQSVQKRLTSITSLTGWLAAAKYPDRIVAKKWGGRLKHKDQHYLKDKWCHLDMDIFNQLGVDIRHYTGSNPDYN